MPPEQQTSTTAAIETAAVALHNFETAWFYAAVFAIGYACAMARWFGQNNLVPIRIIIANSVGSGFAAYCSTALLVHISGVDSGSHFYFCAAAVPVGFMTKEQEKLMSLLFSKFGWKDTESLFEKLDKDGKQ